MKKQMLMNETSTLGHTCFFYEDEQDRLDLLMEYFEQGVTNSELCIFVTADPVHKAEANFASHSDKLADAIKAGSLKIFEMNSTYLPAGKFVVEYMLNNVKSFIEDAKERGYSGLRTAGEMAWINNHPEAMGDALVYEHLVNTLNVPEPSFVGLCLYPVNEVSDELAAGALRCHPTLAYKGKLSNNSIYAYS